MHKTEALSYARYATLVQSSGMGKSRLVDEVAKQVLVIPLNLRERGTRGHRFRTACHCSIAEMGFLGFPPPDEDFRNFWEEAARSRSADECSAYCDTFLTALFRVTLDTLKTIVDKHGPASLPSKFRSHLNEGMSFQIHGQNRRAFCTKVIEEVEKVRTARKPE